MSDEQVIALQARWVFPVASPPLRDGTVVVGGGRILSVGRAADDDGARVIDLGPHALIPGLVNPHTHLEFSDLDLPLGRAGEPLSDWIPEVIAYREARTAGPRAAIERGLAESLRAGVTSLGEIATLPQMASVSGPSPTDFDKGAYAAARQGITAFVELMGLAPERIAGQLELASQLLKSDGQGKDRCVVGLSPHAPYTAHPDLVTGTVELAVRHQRPVAMHLAESTDELELLQSGTGRFADLLRERGFWRADAFSASRRPLDYLEILARAPRSLVIHGNYLNDEELEFVARGADRMAIVYCPRTHAQFGQAQYPLEKLLGLGATVALGTDSRASNPDLDLLAEMRFVAKTFPAVSPAAILQMGTLAGAQALGIVDQVGSIEAGKQADLALVELPDEEAADPCEMLLHAGRKVTTVWCAGVRAGEKGSR